MRSGSATSLHTVTTATTQLEFPIAEKYKGYPGMRSAWISQAECPNPQNGAMNPCLTEWRHESSETMTTYPFSVVDGGANRKMSAPRPFSKPWMIGARPSCGEGHLTPSTCLRTPCPQFLNAWGLLWDLSVAKISLLVRNLVHSQFPMLVGTRIVLYKLWILHKF